MRVIQIAKDNAIELSWMWMPTFIGQNYAVLKELGKAWEERFPAGIAVTTENLDEMHEFTIKWLCGKFNINGLYEYLKAIENVEESGDAL
jgi:hypothetical protein